MAIPTFEEMERNSRIPISERPKAEPLFFQTPEYLRQLAFAFDPKSGLCAASPERAVGASAIKPLTALQSEFLNAMPFIIPGNGEVKVACSPAVHTTMCGVLNSVEVREEEIAEHLPVCGLEFAEVVREQSTLPAGVPMLRVEPLVPDDYEEFLADQPAGVGAEEELENFYGFPLGGEVSGSFSSAAKSVAPPGVPPDVLRDLGSRYTVDGGKAIMAAVRSLSAEPFSRASVVCAEEENLLLSVGLGRFLSMCRSDAVEWLEELKSVDYRPDRSVGRTFRREPLPGTRSWRLGHTHVSVMEACVETKPSGHDWINAETSALALVSRLRLCVRDVDLDRVLWVINDLLRVEKRQFVLVEPTYKWAETRHTKLVPPFPPLPVGVGVETSAPLSQFDMLLSKVFMGLLRRDGSEVPGELCSACLRSEAVGDDYVCNPC